MESELPILAKHFEKILIISLNVRSRPEPEIKENEFEHIREIPFQNVTILPIKFAPKLIYVLNMLTCLTNKSFWAEIKRLKAAGRLNAARCYVLAKYISRSCYEGRIIHRWIKANKYLRDDERALVYSYRFDYQPYVGMMLGKHYPLQIVARAHGRDLYAERNVGGYIPLRETILDKIEAVYCISDHGRRYLERLYPEYSGKIHVRRLGTFDYGCNIVLNHNESLRLVSCSNLIPVKRVHLIIDALKKIKDYPVYWTHFGDGPEKSRLLLECGELSDNIRVEFRGVANNEDILKEYARGSFDLFINVSESEGVPVSIMEALSVGMPVIATDVGGTSEIIQNGYNGILLNEDCDGRAIETAIRKIIELDNRALKRIRTNARSTWESKCNASALYESLAQELVSFCS